MKAYVLTRDFFIDGNPEGEDNFVGVYKTEDGARRAMAVLVESNRESHALTNDKEYLNRHDIEFKAHLCVIAISYKINETEVKE